MSRELIKKLREIKSQDGRLNPDRVWVARNREQMLGSINCSVIVKQESQESSTFVTQTVNNFSKGLHILVSGRVLSFARASMTVMLAGIMAVGGWIASVSASYNSLPGEVLYNVKMAAETTELIVTGMVGSEEDRVATIFKHASNRVDEYQRSESSEQATLAIQSLQKKIESSSESLANAEKESPDEAVAVARVIEEKTDEILDSLAEYKIENKVDAWLDQSEIDVLIASDKELKEEIVKAEDLIQNVGIKAVEVIVQKFENEEVDENVMSKEEVKQTIARKLDKVVSGVSQLDAQVGQTTQLMASSSDIIAANIVSSTDSISSSTGSNIQPDATQKVEAATQKVEAATQKVETTVAEVGTFIEQNNLSAALQKVKELSDVKSETKAVVLEATNAVTQVATMASDSTKAAAITAGQNLSTSTVNMVSSTVNLTPNTTSTGATNFELNKTGSATTTIIKNN